jgi:hypothetical protein
MSTVSLCGSAVTQGGERGGLRSERPCLLPVLPANSLKPIEGPRVCRSVVIDHGKLSAGSARCVILPTTQGESHGATLNHRTEIARFCARLAAGHDLRSSSICAEITAGAARTRLGGSAFGLNPWNNRPVSAANSAGAVPISFADTYKARPREGKMPPGQGEVARRLNRGGVCRACVGRARYALEGLA